MQRVVVTEEDVRDRVSWRQMILTDSPFKRDAERKRKLHQVCMICFSYSKLAIFVICDFHVTFAFEPV